MSERNQNKYFEDPLLASIDGLESLSKEIMEQFLVEAKGAVNCHFKKGDASLHPELVLSLLQSRCQCLHTLLLVKAIQESAESISFELNNICREI